MTLKYNEVLRNSCLGFIGVIFEANGYTLTSLGKLGKLLGVGANEIFIFYKLLCHDRFGT